jgi:hypothetical protein
MSHEPVYIISNHHGIYIPNVFSEMFSDHLSQEDIEDLSSPENPYYWDAWDEILSSFRFNDSGVAYHIEIGPCGDLFMVPEGMSLEDD